MPPLADRTCPNELLGVLEDARAMGFLGKAPINEQIAHARGFVAAVGSAPRHLVDLGSGGGLPGLVLTTAWPAACIMLVDASERRTAFLREAVVRLGAEERIGVLRGRAEELGRDEAWRGWADVVVARSFGGPAATAECAAPLLAVGGRLVVSEAPTVVLDRWPKDGLRLLGLRPVKRVSGVAAHFQVLEQERRCPERYPRRTGVPAHRPLF